MTNVLRGIDINNSSMPFQLVNDSTEMNRIAAMRLFVAVPLLFAYFVLRLLCAAPLCLPRAAGTPP